MLLRNRRSEAQSPVYPVVSTRKEQDRPNGRSRMSGSLTAGGFGSCNPLDEGEGRDKEPERDHDPDNHYKPVEQPRPADRLVALGTRVAEAVGVRRLQCACEPDCWCKTSGLRYSDGSCRAGSIACGRLHTNNEQAGTGQSRLPSSGTE